MWRAYALHFINLLNIEIMANMIKLPFEDGGDLALNVDGAYDVTLTNNDQLDIDYSIAGWTAGEHVQVQLTFTNATLTEGDSNTLLATIKKASQAPNSQPTFQPLDSNGDLNTIAASGGIVIDDV